MNKHPLISVIIPVYNESTNLLWHHEKMVKFLKDAKVLFEIIYVDDGSKDDSLNILRQLAERSSTVRYLRFSRNFGKEQATSAGLHASKGDAAIMLDADGQHPIELLPEFLEKWHAGSQVVIGIRDANVNEGFIKRYGSKLFNSVMNSLTNSSTPKNSTDFRLLDRQVIDEFCKLQEHNRITRGLIDWLGFDRAYIHFTASERHDGKASYSIKKLIKLAIHALVSQTTRPLQVTGYLGSFVMFISTILGIFLLIESYLLHDPLGLNITASGLLALFISFLIGVVLTCQWLLALYIENIHHETQGRPLYIVSEQSKALPLKKTSRK